MATDSATGGGGSALHAAILAGDTSTVISLRNTSPSLCNAQVMHLLRFHIQSLYFTPLIRMDMAELPWCLRLNGAVSTL